MSLRIRGQEVTLRVAIDGVTQQGSMFKVTDFTMTPRQDLQEADYIGEAETDLDVMHHGFDFSFSVDMQDGTSIDLLDDIVARQLAIATPQDVTITVIYNMRETGVSGRVVTYHTCFLKVDEEGAPGRKERVKTKFTCKAKKRETLTQAPD
jgi:hypothetical protein